MSKKDQVAATTEEGKNLPTARPEAGLPVDMSMFEADAGQGFEETDSKCFAIPFLRILQSLSPQCKKTEPEFIKGAEEGNFFNTVTNQVFAEESGVKFVPCYFIRKFTLWTPRGEAGGGAGFQGSLSAADGEELLRNCTKNDKNQDVTPDGLLLVDTREHYGILVHEDGTGEPILFSLSSTQLGKSKKWMSFMRGLKLPNGAEAPMFSHIYNLTTVPEKNDKGSWYGLKWEDGGWTPTQAIYEQARGFREMIRSGAAKPAEEFDQDGKPF
jgi:hypothetical protein